MLMTGLGYVNLYYDSSLESFKCKDSKLNNCKNKIFSDKVSLKRNAGKYTMFQHYLTLDRLLKLFANS